jgi:hypothetical protein
LGYNHGLRTRLQLHMLLPVPLHQLTSAWRRRVG